MNNLSYKNIPIGYTCRIDYKWSHETAELTEKQQYKFDNDIKKISKKYNVDIMTWFLGGAACFPYFEFYSNNLDNLKQVIDEVTTYIDENKKLMVIY